jgi:hypothetical protein
VFNADIKGAEEFHSQLSCIHALNIFPADSTMPYRLMPEGSGALAADAVGLPVGGCSLGRGRQRAVQQCGEGTSTTSSTCTVTYCTVCTTANCTALAASQLVPVLVLLLLVPSSVTGSTPCCGGQRGVNCYR